jgi:glycosyltransferase involved in cell wall biosynthesis
MHGLSVGCLFKNESDSVIEWIEHHIYHGVEHFYLINDGSDDDTCKKLEPYVERGLVTLFHAEWNRYLGRQRDMYNHYILPLLHESKWLLMIDMDEYAWSPHNIDIKVLLKDCDEIGQIQLNHTLFGSAGYQVQPKSLVKYFINRSSQLPTERPTNRKYIINSSFKFTSLNVHHATFLDKEDELHKFIVLDHIFRINHYSCQSRNLWAQVKCKRGDGDHFRERTVDLFFETDINEVEDIGLYLQNKELIEKLLKDKESR